MTPAEVKALTLAEFRALCGYQREWVKVTNEANRRR
jgi:hypothetical protein